ncbi:hypothetical protein [Vreelandella titanicae]|uniref:hypothetical protein n=1 Tax=Vreelandella titanicae TaxID=664683 RepID=UPI0039BFBFB8
MSEASYFFPISLVVPEFDNEAVTVGRFLLAKRKWNTSTFDLATLATKHQLHLPYQLMDVLIGKCNCELQVDNVETREAAQLYFHSVRIGLYVQQISPFLCPYVTNVSINDYSGVNERDSAISQGKEPEIASTFNSASAKLEAWPVELSLHCVAIPNAFILTERKFGEAARFAEKWFGLCEMYPAVRAISNAITTAGRLESYEQSILHMWTAMEALFPNVSTEVSFKIALYLAQLCAPPSKKKEFHTQAKKAYSVRSKIAHGSSKKFKHEDWLQSWQLILACVSAIAERGGLPSEENLLDELLCAGA